MLYNLHDPVPRLDLLVQEDRQEFQSLRRLQNWSMLSKVKVKSECSESFHHPRRSMERSKLVAKMRSKTVNVRLR